MAIFNWHIADPMRFEQDLRVTIQALGWRSKGRCLPLHNDIVSAAFWYKSPPAAAFPSLPDKNYMEVV